MKALLVCTAMCALLPGCADGTLLFGGGGTFTKENDNLVVSGDIDDVQLADASGAVSAVPAGRDVVVFVYSDLRCCNAAFVPATDLPFRAVDFQTPPFDTVELSDLRFADVESVIVAGGKGSFSVSDVSSGDLTVLFLLDEAVADGAAEAGDPVAVLADDDSRMDRVESGRTVTLDAVDITFDRSFPDGAAVADSITVARTDSSSP